IISAGAAIAAVACSLLFAQPVATFRPANLRSRLGQLRHPLANCPGGFREFDRACFPLEFDGLIRSAANYLQQRSGPADSVVIFPYQYMFGMTSERKVASGVLQSFLA